jgi:hypothetical protein
VTIPSLAAALCIQAYIEGRTLALSSLNSSIAWLIEETEARGFEVDLYTDMTGDEMVRRAIAPLGPAITLSAQQQAWFMCDVKYDTSKHYCYCRLPCLDPVHLRLF